MKAEYVCVVINDGKYFTWQTSGRTAFWIIAKEYAKFEWLTSKDLGGECLLNAYKGHYIFVAPLNKKAKRLLKERKNRIGGSCSLEC